MSRLTTLIKQLPDTLTRLLSTKRAIQIQLAIFVPVGLLILNANSPLSLVYNYTPSIPKGIYISSSGSLPSYLREQLICFKADLPAWAVSRGYSVNPNFCKHVSGLPGDTVTLLDNHGTLQIVLKDRSSQVIKTLDIVKHDTLHRPIPQQSPWSTHLTPNQMLQPNQPQTIPPGYFYVTGEVANSLDSRYLGPIPGHTIYATLKPLILF